MDDDPELCALLTEYLGQEFSCASAYDGQSGLEMASNKILGFDLVILDVMLPMKNGFEVLRALRRVDQSLPVIMLTAKGDPVDRVVGLEMGADDYLGKPFDPRELLARIRSVFRRLATERDRTETGLLKVDGLFLNEHTLQTFTGNRSLNLTPAEFKVFWILVQNAGKIVSRENLFRQALGRGEHAFDRSLDMHISRIRKKVWSDNEGMKKIRNIRGEGYLYAPYSDSDPDF
ncbi:MAG: response regulator transcription factor [Deltaproteobacteria bacterium]|nr:response regulator transcription factor [Deltaproteobacteria bacterium]